MKPKFVAPQFKELTTYAEIFFRASLSYDCLKCQRNLTKTGYQYASKFVTLQGEIAELMRGETICDRINTRSEAKRKAWKKEKIKECRRAYNALWQTQKSRVNQVTKLQKKQKECIKKLRAENSKYVLANRTTAAVKRREEHKALAKGHFWECEEQTLKDFFHVPFTKRKLVDVSERFRAALFVELELEEYPYKSLVPTNRAYLCGVDDNSEEWGFQVFNNDGPCARGWEYKSTVVEAMAIVWDINKDIVKKSYRQGELLFHPASFSVGSTLRRETIWDVAPAHTVSSPTLSHNGDSFASTDPITVSHPTHAPLVLPAGEYRVFIHSYAAD